MLGGGLDLNLSDIYTEVIAEHSAHSSYRKMLKRADIIKAGVNPSCGDEIEISLQMQGDIIEDIAFSGVGCAISQASTSMMAELVHGKEINEGRRLADIFLKMIKGSANESEIEELEEAGVLSNIANMPARVKCAVLSWHTLIEALSNY